MSMSPWSTLHCITLAFTNWLFHIQRVHTGLCLGSNRRDYGNNVSNFFFFVWGSISYFWRSKSIFVSIPLPYGSLYRRIWQGHCINQRSIIMNNMIEMIPFRISIFIQCFQKKQKGICALFISLIEHILQSYTLIVCTRQSKWGGQPYEEIRRPGSKSAASHHASIHWKGTARRQTLHWCPIPHCHAAFGP